MKKHVRLVIAAATLCLLPVLLLSPVLFGAEVNNCGFKPFNGPCNYSAGCVLTIYQCSTYNMDATGCAGDLARQSALQVNLFTCVDGKATEACNPVTNTDGSAATTNCIIKYNCTYNQMTGACTQNVQVGTCVAPYYKPGTCVGE